MVRRSITEVAGASSSAKGRVVESKVEMDVRMELEQGKHVVVKYRVNSSARMQSVINKVGVLFVTSLARANCFFAIFRSTGWFFYWSTLQMIKCQTIKKL